MPFEHGDFGYVKTGEITRYLKREGEFLAMFFIGVILFSVPFICYCKQLELWYKRIISYAVVLSKVYFSSYFVFYSVLLDFGKSYQLL